MKKKRAIITHIFFTQAFFFVFQSAFYTVLAFIFSFEFLISILFYATSLFLHVITGCLLIVLKDSFVYEDGRVCTSMDVPNGLTLARISSIPTIFFLVIIFVNHGKNMALLFVIIPFVSLVFLTDFLDGILARKLNQITRIGKYLDSSSDYLLIFFTSIIFYVLRFIPLWFFIVILVRLLLQAVGVFILSVKANKIVYTISFLGKMSVFSTMFLYVAELIRSFLHQINAIQISGIVLEIIVGGILIVSLFEKVLILIKESK